MSHASEQQRSPKKRPGRAGEAFIAVPEQED
jgi:hypothetical protein